MSGLRRYPGVRSFEERDRFQFRGRKAAAEELLLRVLSVRLLLQFAPSGVGKTSLLTAGLFPRLREHDYFPFIVRLNQAGESLVDAVRRSLAQAAADCGLVEPVIPAQADSLAALLAGTQLWSAQVMLLSPVLVFDQFEECFTLRDAAFRADFAQQVGELASGNADRGSPLQSKFILSLREEYLGKLEDFSVSIPELFRERLRLSPLSPEEALEAIIEPAALEGEEWASPPFGYTPEALTLLIDFIDGASETVKVIEPLTLQLVCHHAEGMAMERRAGAGTITLGVQDFGGLAGLDRLVRDHYRQVLDGINPRGARRRAQAMFEERLLDPAGKRLMVEQGEIEREYRLEAPVLDTLVAASLLRREPRNESVFYEISHDRLTDTIAKHRKLRLPRWVWPTLGTGALFLGLAVWSWWTVRQQYEQTQAARDQAAYAVGQLLGEPLVSRLREAGLSDALRQIMDQTDASTQAAYAPGLEGVLRLRHAADLQRDAGTLEQAQAAYQLALQTLRGLPVPTDKGASALLRAEQARILTAQGSLAVDAGDLARAGALFVEAQRHWQEVLKAEAQPRPQELLDAADGLIAYANQLGLIGEYDVAETQALAASRLAMRVWSGAYEGGQRPGADANFDVGRAVQVFADAALALSRPRLDTGLADTAIALAEESVRLRPLSFQARKQFGIAITSRFSMALPTSDKDWAELAKAGPLFDDLGQVDGANLRMRRERAAVALAAASIVAICGDVPACQKSMPAGSPERARRDAVESTGVFRWLGSADPANRSLKADEAWGLRVQSRLLWNDREPEQAPLLERAIALRVEATIDPKDFSTRLERAFNLLDRASRQATSGRADDARASAEQALTEFDGLPEGLIGMRIEKVNLLWGAAGVLRQARLEQEAKAMDVRYQALKLPDGPVQKGRSAAISLGEKASEQAEAAKEKPEGMSVREGLAIEALYGQAVHEFPFDPLIWNDLRLARNAVADAEGSSTQAGATRALRGALSAAWMAKVLDAGPQRLRQLYDARFSLAKSLFDSGDGGPELLALTEQALADAQELARKQNRSPDSLSYLADAYSGVGYARQSLKRAGWDEAFGLSFQHLEQLARLEPKDPESFLRLGTGRSAVADMLDQEKRNAEASQQRRLALAACKSAQSLSKAKPDHRARADACLDDLAKAGGTQKAP